MQKKSKQGVNGFALM